MSKTSGGAIWLSSDTRAATSPYAFYQYWINLPDADVVQWLKWFTLLSREEIDAVARRHEAEPHKRLAQESLAREMTDLVHGRDMRERIEGASRALFSGDVRGLRGLDDEMLREVFAEVPHSSHARASLEDGGVALVDLLPQTTLAASKREAREFLANGAVSVNGERAAPDQALTTKDLLHGRLILLRRGKKHWHATRWE
jgi:tyrosyl-tRNA synthetase